MLSIRPLTESDYPEVQRIHQQGIDDGNATFETRTRSWSEWNSTTAPCCRLVAVLDTYVIGWASLTEANSRCVSTGVAETSVYIDNRAQRRGVGSALLLALIEASEQAGYWTLLARIFPENVASIALHEKCDFRRMGVHQRLGRLNGVWRDVQLLERRSRVVGLD